MPFKNEKLNWEDLRLFLWVAKAGGLSGASALAGVSAPTLSRRMTGLEKALGATLFERLQSGYRLTAQGEELLARVQEMEEKSRAIQQWQKHLHPRPVVRITSGAWTSVFIARHLHQLSERQSGPRIELLIGADFLNLSRREADLAIRNKMPEQQGLARRRIGSVAFAVYGSPCYVENNPQAQSEERFEACDWAALTAGSATGLSSSWLQERIGESPRLSCSSPHSVLEAAISGAGLCVLPRFIGGSEKGLVCCSDPIDALTHNQWQVSHDESRWSPSIMQVSRSLFELFRQHQDSFV